jgi:formyl-CoA transferase
MSGLLSVLTDLDDPKGMGVSLSDHLTGMMAAYGILGALVARGRTGKGQRVETSLLEASIAFLGENAARYFETGKVPSRATRTKTALVFAFTDRDRKPFVVHLSSPTKFFAGLAHVVGHDEWLTDPRFKSKKDRQQNYDALHDALARIFRGGSRDQWLASLLENDVPAAPIYELDEVFADPQVQHLRLLRTVSHPKVGEIKLVGGGVSLSGTPATIRTAAPGLGDHTQEILARLGRQPVPAK